MRLVDACVFFLSGFKMRACVLCVCVSVFVSLSLVLSVLRFGEANSVLASVSRRCGL